MLKAQLQKKLGSLRLDVDLQLDNTGITVLRGESGAGKTTIAHMLCGLVEPDDGSIELEGLCVFDKHRSINLPPAERGIGCVFQTPRLFPNMSVADNIRFPLVRGGRTARLNLEEAVAILGLEDLLTRAPATLSGGEAQRVAIGRALMSAERLLILDEPLSSLDPPRRRLLIDYILRCAAALDVPVLCITHSDEETRRLAQPPGRALQLRDGTLSPLSLTSVDIEAS